MESEKVALSRGSPNPNPKTIPTMAGESQKSPATAAPVLERFKALLRQRDDDLRVSADDAVSAPRTEEIVQLYELVLSELTFNSKPIITDLTIIAGDHRDHAKGIADAICARVLEVSVEHKLPSLYLLDSIVKNIGREYVKHFSSRLPEVFCEAYRQVHPSQHVSMRHLFGTWRSVFPPHVLDNIEAQLQFSPSVNQPPSRLPPLRASESPRQIHVNPKYFRQFEHSAADNHIQPSGEDSGRKLYAQKPSIGVMDRDDEMNKWPSKPYQNQIHRDTSASNKLSNGRERQGPRALIDAYGTDDRLIPSSDRPLRVERLDTNGLDHRPSTMLWQNSDEEEFNWEAMSPTLSDHRNGNFLPSSIPSLRNVKARPNLGPSRGMSMEFDIRNRWSSQGQLPAADESPIVGEDAVSSFSFGRGSVGNISQFHNEANRNVVSRYPQEPWNMHQSHSQLPHHLNPRGRGTTLQTPFPGDNMPPLLDKLPDVDTQIHRSGPVVSRIGSTNDSISSEVRPIVVPAPGGPRAPVHLHNSHPPPLHPLPMHSQKGQFDFINTSNTVKNQGPNNSFYAPGNPLDRFENKELYPVRLPQLPDQSASVAPMNHQNQIPTPLPPRLLPAHERHETFLSTVTNPLPPQLVTPNQDRGYIQGHVSSNNAGVSNQVVPPLLNFTTNNIPNSSFHLHGRGFPPLPRGPPPPPSLQTILPSHNAGPATLNQQPGNAFSGLISSLMAQGLISLTKNPAQESVGLDFNVDLLKVRHDSAINALYGDLQRQCTTCGLRFKGQEEHRSHMDWHVTKNRMSKNRKQKPSRKWFVSAAMWLSGAEALGTEAVPGFLPAEAVVEKKSDEEMAVPADEDQNACALCGEPFEEFYSDETEEWMYRGAVYLNTPEGSTEGIDRSHLGPIVHAKCRSESSVVPPEDFGHDERGSFEEGSQRKRLRS